MLVRDNESIIADEEDFWSHCHSVLRPRFPKATLAYSLAGAAAEFDIIWPEGIGRKLFSPSINL